jgi:hypothetical protein
MKIKDKMEDLTKNTMNLFSDNRNVLIFVLAVLLLISILGLHFLDGIYDFIRHLIGDVFYASGQLVTSSSNLVADATKTTIDLGSGAINDVGRLMMYDKSHEKTSKPSPTGKQQKENYESSKRGGDDDGTRPPPPPTTNVPTGLTSPPPPPTGQPTKRHKKCTAPKYKPVHNQPIELPEGWEMFFDERTGRIYYVNRSMGYSQWEVPRSDVILPPGWEELFDPKLGQYYYVNRTQKISQWDVPSPGQSNACPTTPGVTCPQCSGKATTAPTTPMPTMQTTTPTTKATGDLDQVIEYSSYKYMNDPMPASLEDPIQKIMQTRASKPFWCTIGNSDNLNGCQSYEGDRRMFHPSTDHPMVSPKIYPYSW